MADRQTKRRGRPPRNRDLHAFRAVVELGLYQELQRRADDLGVSLTSYVNSTVCLAFGHEDPYLPAIGDYIPAGLEQLQEYAVSDGPRAHGVLRSGPGRSLGLLVDRRVADQVERRAVGLGISYADFVRALLRVSQHGAEPAAWNEQGSLDLEGVAV